MNLDAILAAGRPTTGVFRSFEDQESGCRSDGAEEAGQRVFLKLGPPERPRILLDAGDNEDAWRGTAAQFLIVTRATEPDPADRYQRLGDFSDAWRSAWG
jgi:hypothetical protein